MPPIAAAAFFADLGLWDIFLWSGRLLGAAFVPLVILQRSARPLSALAWILGLLLVPYLGVVVWWLIGRNHLERTKRRHARSRRAADDRRSASPAHPPPFEPVDANGVAFFATSDEAFEAFATAIEGATDEIHLFFYIWKPDAVGRRFRDLLVDAAQRGVDVRACYDAVGGVRLNRAFFAGLEDAGAQVATFLPVRIWELRSRINFRNHRKLLIVDGQYAFSGGVNLADEYRQWLDTAFAVSGPVVDQFQELFCDDWYFATAQNLAESARRWAGDATDMTPAQLLRQRLGNPDLPVDLATAQMVASGPDERLDWIHKRYFTAINGATSRLWISTPYFVPDLAILTALETAALRGVDLRVVVPAQSDVALTQHAGRFYWERLLNLGATIYEFQDTVLHTKAMVIDDDQVLMGSANMDIRSFRLNFEANCAFESTSLNRRLAAFFEQIFANSQTVDAEAFLNRPFQDRFLEGTARLFSPLL